VLELRSTAGQGGGPERALLLAAAAARDAARRAAAERDGAAVIETLAFLRRRGEDELQFHRRALELGADSHVVEEGGAIDLRTLGRLRRLTRERSIDIVHAHDYKADFYGTLLARLEGTTPVATVHGWPVRTRRERFVYYPADRRLLRSFPLVFAVADDLRDRLLAAGAESSRVVTLPNAVDVEVFRPDAARRARVRAEWGVAEREPVIGTLGRLDSEKRPDLLVEAFAAVAERWPRARLVIAGGRSRGTPIESMVERLGLRDRCLLLGHRADAEDVLRGFDVFVQASDSEGSPYSLLEAMATATPVVATAVGDVPGLLQSEIEGLLVSPGDAVALAGAIEASLRSPDAAARRADAARARVIAERSLRVREERLAEGYRAVLESRPRFATPATLI
jgi:glycosyltransferase involved in cell wall biosynthesis